MNFESRFFCFAGIFPTFSFCMGVFLRAANFEGGSIWNFFNCERNKRAINTNFLMIVNDMFEVIFHIKKLFQTLMVIAQMRVKDESKICW